MIRAHRVRLEPNNRQRTMLARSAGVSRFAYNWALANWGQAYAASTYPELGESKKPNQLSLRRELNSIKREQFPWMLEVTKCAPQEAIIDLGKAFDAFFKQRARYPTFKKRGQRDSFRVSAGTFTIKGDRLRLPVIGWVRMSEAVRWIDAQYLSVTVSRTADHWFASISCELAEPAPTPQSIPHTVVGVDVGVNEYVTSTGDRYQVPRSYRRSQRQLRRAQQALARKQRGSANRAKHVTKVARIHERTANIRRDWLHQTTTAIAHSANVIVVEDLNVRGMTRNRHLSKSVLDAGFGEFRRQLTYKTQTLGTELVTADRWFPSSKLCSTCGTKTKSLQLSIREWTCETCNTVHDRDVNAAINLAALTLPGGTRWQPVESSPPLTSSEPRFTTRQATSMKQESDRTQAVPTNTWDYHCLRKF